MINSWNSMTEGTEGTKETTQRDASGIKIPHSWFRFSKAGLEKVCKKAGMFGSLKIW